MVLIMIDECGSEIEIDRYTIGDDLDDDYIELWKLSKEEKAREQYPEARGFFFEDRRHWNSLIQQTIWEDEGYWWDDEEEIEK